MIIKKIVLVSLIFCLFFITGATNIQTRAEQDIDLSEKSVLFISSYSPSFNTYYSQIEGLRSVFDGTGVVFEIECMDTKRFYTDEHLDNFYTSLKYKIEEGAFYNVIIVGDDNALDFVLEHEELFPTQEIVFLGINNVEKAEMVAEDPSITGIYESVSIKETVELANRVMPEARRVIALTDNTVTGQVVKEIYWESAEGAEDLTWDIIDLSDMTFAEYEIELLKIAPQDIVLLLAVHRDITGTSISFEEGVKRTVRNLQQPVFTIYEFGIGGGLLAGDVVSYYDQGRVAGEIARDIMLGVDIATMEVVRNKTVPMADYNMLKVYNLSTRDFPSDTIFINRDENLFLLILPYILVGFVIILIEGALIIHLRFNIINRKKAEDELVEKRKELVKSNDELISLNEEMSTSNEDLLKSNEKLSQAAEIIEEQKKEILDLIYLDYLTGLKNRRAIFELISDWFDKADGRYLYAILFLDVDNFKLVNDSYGHDFGDQVIIETGSRIVELETKDIQFGRFGGDEFLIVYRDKNLNRFSAFLTKLENLFRKPFAVGDQNIILTVSIGVAIYPIHGTTESELVKKADMALYKAKEEGKNRAVIFDMKMNDDIEDKISFQSQIRRDFRKQNFYLNYQPVFDLKKRRYIGAEALIRWDNIKFGRVPANKLIEAAEEMGIIVEIGKWVLEEACRFAKKINEKAEENIMISINISTVQLMHPDFLDDLMDIIKETGVRVDHICFEMTETTLFHLSEENKHVIPRIKDLNICMALDDFGTGYSSLSYFKNIPANILKIDKQFIDHISANESDRFTVKTMIELAHHKGLEVVAEGVEYADQLEILMGLDCDIVQGYYYSKPMMPEDVTNILLG